MQHQIPIEKFGPVGESMAHQVKACVHCGFCLPACPTYKVLGQEMDSPRGRIFLMKEVLEGKLNLEDAIPYVDKCLGCQACVPVCPSGVEYGELLTPFRAYAEEHRQRGPLSQITRLLLRTILPFPKRFYAAATLGRLAHPLRHLLPQQLRAMLELLPPALPKASPFPEVFPAKAKRRARVVLLAGCVQQVLAPQINWATLRVLAENGVEVVIPKNQNCCGALAMHSGQAEQARALARQNFQSFPKDVDAVLTNAAGCGSGMKEYPLLFKGLPEEEEAAAFARGVKDVTVFLDELGLKSSPSLKKPLKLAYHDACHLAHAQGVREAPRKVLGSIPNVTLLEIPEGEFCCGSAGTYNLEQPEIARSLGEQKARNILQTGAEAVAAGNIGCITQIQTHLKALGQPLPIYHTLELLDRAYQAS
ncbi:heterodisulfide reductase-related iron-sulfur binding cluster [Acidobacteria bacterium AH-259-O06]|nr:heterodisulfide reductase-related iron-sulfur binding cluster [Acidobacteria bacterium AH-259-O06]